MEKMTAKRGRDGLASGMGRDSPNSQEGAVQLEDGPGHEEGGIALETRGWQRSAWGDAQCGWLGAGWESTSQVPEASTAGDARRAGGGETVQLLWKVLRLPSNPTATPGASTVLPENACSGGPRVQMLLENGRGPAAGNAEPQGTHSLDGSLATTQRWLGLCKTLPWGGERS